MSKKLLVLSLLSLSICLYWCGTQNNDTDSNLCEDWSVCSNEIINEEPANEIEAETATKRATSEIESDIEWFEENVDEIPVAQEVNWEPITISGWGRDM